MSVVTAESTIRKVVVYSDRAQIFRTGTVNVGAGDHVVTFNGLWRSVNRDTLQVALTPSAGAAVILRGVQFTTVHDVVDVRPQRRAIDEKILALEDPMRGAQDECDLADRAQKNYEALRAKLTTQMKDSTKGSPFVYDTATWAKFNSFINDGVSKHRGAKRVAERKLAALASQKGDLEMERARLGRGDEQRTSREVAEVTLSVATAAAGAKVDLEMLLSYMVNGASWKPSYDLRIDKKNKSMGVTYNANVQQSTGEDWKDVRLELSTAKAHVGGEIPTFTTTWYLRRRSAAPPSGPGGYGGGGMPMQNMMMQQMMPSMSNMMAAPGAPPSSRAFATVASSAAEVSSSSTSVTFTIAALSTVQANNEPVKVTIAIFDLPIFFRYSAVPRIDPSVYLKVKATNSTDFPLLAGPSNIFADEQLVSRSQMDDVAPREEFWTFLGQDGSITCARKELSKKTVEVSGGLFSKNRMRIEYSYRFTSKNTKSTQEEVVVWDQMPISEDSRIAVTLVSPKPDREGQEPRNKADAPLFKINDVKFIEWFVNLLPGEERVYDYVFHVEYPQEETIVL